MDKFDKFYPLSLDKIYEICPLAVDSLWNSCSLRYFDHLSGVIPLRHILSVNQGLLPADELILVCQLRHVFASAKRMPPYKLKPIGIHSAQLIADIHDGVVVLPWLMAKKREADCTFPYSPPLYNSQPH